MSYLVVFTVFVLGQRAVVVDVAEFVRTHGFPFAVNLNADASVASTGYSALVYPATIFVDMPA
jgi:hypothetical protein